MDGETSETVVLWESDRTKGNVLRLSQRVYRGKPFIDLREWYTDAAGALAPGRRGLTLRVGEVAALAAALGRVTP
jgi:hypothetical protein